MGGALTGCLDRAQQTLLILLLSFMVLVAFTQIVLRNVFTTGLAWSDRCSESRPLVGFSAPPLRPGKGNTSTSISFPLISLQREKTSRWQLPRPSRSCLPPLTYGALKFIRNESAMGNVTFLESCLDPGNDPPRNLRPHVLSLALRFLRHLSMLRRGRGSRRQGEER